MREIERRDLDSIVQNERRPSSQSSLSTRNSGASRHPFKLASHRCCPLTFGGYSSLGRLRSESHLFTKKERGPRFSLSEGIFKTPAGKEPTANKQMCTNRQARRLLECVKITKFAFAPTSTGLERDRRRLNRLLKNIRDATLLVGGAALATALLRTRVVYISRRLLN